MSSAEKFEPRYTVDDYMQWEGDWELWHGTPVSMSPSPNAYHQKVVAKMIRLLGDLVDASPCRSQCEVLMELDWKVADDTMVRPDVLITCDPLPKQHLLSPPVFIAEILSPSTSRKDRVFKRELYRVHGVRYYAIVDPIAKAIELFALASDDIYQPVSGSNAQLQLTDTCKIELNFTDVFE